MDLKLLRSMSNNMSEIKACYGRSIASLDRIDRGFDRLDENLDAIKVESYPSPWPAAFVLAIIVLVLL